ncbi:helix-turn-helix domain-containing protein [Jiulongibacter sp. NS-SX5]|uniref:helix-turn-helix domain-containing protein n=1 Tax=Jiulongibacter sp. NS-SX5 TaxID=3463854 RepID=UPI004058168E
MEKKTGKSAKEYIQIKTIDIAEEKIFEEKTVNEIAYDLGFKYPQHFTRLFKQKVGMSPLEWRGAN